MKTQRKPGEIVKLYTDEFKLVIEAGKSYMQEKEVETIEVAGKDEAGGTLFRLSDKDGNLLAELVTRFFIAYYKQPEEEKPEDENEKEDDEERA